MKIEFIKEEIGNGIVYSTNVDGKFVSNSCASTEEEGFAIFKKIILNNGVLKIKTVLFTHEISDNEPTKNKTDINY